jgi:phenylpropionate dioxygenase-like ring-hydroxylating dioxygenase large terminal subunit
MIRNQWYAVMESREIRKGKPVGVTRMGEKLVFWRDKSGHVSCLVDKCAHRGAQLSIGKCMGDKIQCPFHGFEYDSTGRCTLVPANGMNAPVPEQIRMNAYPVREEHDFIWIWWGDQNGNLPPVPFFDDIDDRFSYSTIVDPWNTHYSRAIENQLDVVHVPFVHHNTIGRGNRKLVNGPSVVIESDEIRIWTNNVHDDGRTAPLKPEEMPERGLDVQHLHFRFPNVWQNWITKKLRVVAFFVPVDGDHTLMYLRFYQNFLRLPGLRRLVNLLGGVMNFVIERQDRRVVNTQQPKASTLLGNEKLIPGDRPVVLYRKERKALKEKAGQTE